MNINELPKYDMSDNPTNCCPRFKSEGWDEQELHFKDKLFVKAKTKSFFHIPLNMDSVFTKTFAAIDREHARNDDDFVVLSHDSSNWAGEHYFSVTKNVSGQEMIHMTGNFLTKVFEGPYKDVPKWEKDMETFVNRKGGKVSKTYFFYTTCPKCAKYYGKNYMVAIAQVDN